MHDSKLAENRIIAKCMWLRASMSESVNFKHVELHTRKWISNNDIKTKIYSYKQTQSTLYGAAPQEKNTQSYWYVNFLGNHKKS